MVKLPTKGITLILQIQATFPSSINVKIEGMMGVTADHDP